MELYLNWIAIFIATLVGTAIAGVWYQEPVFGKAWRSLTGVTPKQSKQAGNSPLIIMLVANFVTAATLAIAISIAAGFYGGDSILLALTVGFVICLAFSATTLVVHNGFELKRKKLTLINSLYQFVLFLSMALIIGVFGG